MASKQAFPCDDHQERNMIFVIILITGMMICTLPLTLPKVRYSFSKEVAEPLPEAGNRQKQQAKTTESKSPLCRSHAHLRIEVFPKLKMLAVVWNQAFHQKSQPHRPPHNEKTGKGWHTQLTL